MTLINFSGNGPEAVLIRTPRYSSAKMLSKIISTFNAFGPEGVNNLGSLPVRARAN